MKLRLHRIYLEEATLGVLELPASVPEAHRRLWTLEDKFDGNQPGTCVPEGRYKLERHEGKVWKNTWALVGETVSHWPDPAFKRSAILIHAGNTTDDVRGCILVGLDVQFGLEQAPAVFASGSALTRLIRHLAGEPEHELVIQRG